MLKRISEWRQKRRENAARRHWARAMIMIDRDQFCPALDEIDMAFALGSQDNSLWHLKSKALAALGRAQPALEALEHYIAAEPEHMTKLPIYCQKARLLTALGRKEEGLSLLEDGLRMALRLRGEWSDPMKRLMRDSVAELWGTKAHILAEMERADEARECRAMEQATSLELVEDYEERLKKLTPPMTAQNRASRRFMLVSLGRYEEALDSLEDDLRSNPSDAELWMEKGSIFKKMECLAEAAACYEMGIERGGGGDARDEIADRARAWKELPPALPYGGRFSAIQQPARPRHQDTE